MTTTPLHDSIPAYSGTGKLLNEYCNSQHYILLDGPTPYWAPFVGCNQDKADCCPYQVASSTDSGNGAVPTVTVVKTITVNVGPGGVTSAYTGINAYPAAATVAQGTLARCPDDYVSVSGGCCPSYVQLFFFDSMFPLLTLCSGYDLWNAVLGGQVPCYSSLKNLATPPPVPVQNYQTPASLPVTAKPSSSSSTISYGSNKPTSAVVNVVYAVQYPLTPSPGLSTGAKAGIGAGAGVGALVIIGLTAALIWRTKKHKRDKKAFEAAAAGAGTTPMTGTGTGSQAGLASTPRGGGTGTDPSLMSASTAASPGHSVIQTPGSFAPNGGYFPPPPVYNAPMHQQQHHHQQQQQVYYGHHPQEMSSTQLDPHELGGPGQGQLHPDFDPRYHSTPPPSSVSPPPPSEGGHSAQGAGAGTYSELSGQTPRSQVAMPVPVNQTSPMRRPVGASPVPSAISPQTTGGGGGQYVSPQSTGGRQGYGVQEGMYGAPPGMQYHAQ